MDLCILTFQARDLLATTTTTFVFNMCLNLIHCFQVSKISSQNPKLWLSFVLLDPPYMLHVTSTTLFSFTNNLNTSYGEHYILVPL
mmetsp:Transcript_4066/g.5530  ORF Transcript_4066/g.5530 Transcript_4066/m.5530 type:complete len:86 (-) Transcript_4066:6-263(-)